MCACVFLTLTIHTAAIWPDPPFISLSVSRRRVSPKVDVRIVIAVTITLISIVQYYGAWQRYNEAIDYLARNPKYRLAALEVAKDEGMVDNTKKRGKERKDKTTLREEEEALIRNVIENKMDIKGAHRYSTMGAKST